MLYIMLSINIREGGYLIQLWFDAVCRDDKRLKGFLLGLKAGAVF